MLMESAPSPFRPSDGWCFPATPQSTPTAQHRCPLHHRLSLRRHRRTNFFWFPTATDSYTYSPYDPYPSPQTTNPACSLPLELCEPSTSLPRSTTRPSGPAWECVGRVCGGIHKGSLLPTGFTVEGICGSIFLPFPPQLGPCPTALSSPAHFLVFCRVISFPPQFLN